MKKVKARIVREGKKEGRKEERKEGRKNKGERKR